MGVIIWKWNEQDVTCYLSITSPVPRPLHQHTTQPHIQSHLCFKQHQILMQKSSPVFNITWIWKLLNNYPDVIEARVFTNQTMFYHVLQVCKAVNNILHVWQWSCSRTRRPIPARNSDRHGQQETAVKATKSSQVGILKTATRVLQTFPAV